MVKVPEGPVCVANPAKLVSKVGAADPSAPDKPKRLSVPPGYACLKAGHWQHLRLIASSALLAKRRNHVEVHVASKIG